MARPTKYTHLIKILKKYAPTGAFFSLLVLLVYTRLINLSWGFSFLMHPDENNIMSSAMQLSCSRFNLLECFNPHFFAYGQLTIYASSLIANLLQWGLRVPTMSPLFITFALRLISAACSIATGILLYKIVDTKLKNKWFAAVALFLYVFTPALIQQSHFGTTESLLTFLLLLTLYFEHSFLLQSICIGLAIAAKPSGATFLIVPFIGLIGEFLKKKNLALFLVQGVLVILMVAGVTLLFSPHYLLHWADTLSTFTYESGVATGAAKVFYTRQFENTVPFLFQFEHILPFAAGWAITILGFVGFLFTIKKFPRYVLTFIVLYAYSASLYAKWTRFIVPYFPLLIISSTTVLFYFFQKTKKLTIQIVFYSALALTLGYQLIVGLSFLTVYQTTDSRYVATNWIVKHIPFQSRLVSESANVIDVPLGETNNYVYVSPFINDIDANMQLRDFVMQNLETAQYVLIPSRRVFADYTCWTIAGKDIVKKSCPAKPTYPALQKYYDVLLDPSRYEQIGHIASYPRLSLFGVKLTEFPDEEAEETWTVFDHPVIRIYKKIAKPTP